MSHYAKAATLTSEIHDQVSSGALHGEALDRALQIANIYARLAQADAHRELAEATREQTELARAMKRAHPSSRKRTPEPKPAPVTLLRPNGDH